MAVRPVHKDAEFQGFSSDPKVAGPDGATLHLIDTGEVLVCHEGAWSLDLRMARAIVTAELLK
jgi:hypothetical protein